MQEKKEYFCTDEPIFSKSEVANPFQRAGGDEKGYHRFMSRYRLIFD
jgi:hypothetical protein